MSLTANKNYATDGLSRRLRVHVTASGSDLHLYRGAILAVDPSTGYAAAASDKANVGQLAGVLTEEAIIPDGTSDVVALECGRVWLDFASAAVTDIGSFVYATADDTIAKSASNADPCGMIIDVRGGTQALVDFSKGLPVTALSSGGGE